MIFYDVEKINQSPKKKSRTESKKEEQIMQNVSVKVDGGSLQFWSSQSCLYVCC